MNCAHEWGYLMVRNKKKLGNLITMNSFREKNKMLGIIICLGQKINLPSLFSDGRKSSSEGVAGRQKAASFVSDMVAAVSVKSPGRFKMDNKYNSLCADHTHPSNVGFPGLFIVLPSFRNVCYEL